jgi:ribosomal protein S20
MPNKTSGKKSEKTSDKTSDETSDKKSATKIKTPVEHWQEKPEEHDYPAAAEFLSLIYSPDKVRRVVLALKEAPLERRKAKDLLRASELALLPAENAHVAIDLDKVKRGSLLSPVLLMRGDVTRGIPLTIADGYHRVCASYHLDENADIPCHMADFAV